MPGVDGLGEVLAGGRIEGGSVRAEVGLDSRGGATGRAANRRRGRRCRDQQHGAPRLDSFGREDQKGEAGLLDTTWKDSLVVGRGAERNDTGNGVN